MIKAIIATLLLSLASLFGNENQPATSRPASLSEISELFNLAIDRPSRSHFVADITLKSPAWTKDQIGDELRLQNEKDMGESKRLTIKQMADLVVARSNAIVKSHSGIRIQHVEEWYSGHLYRLDLTDEAVASAKYLQTNTNGFHETFVNIHDLAFSPYISFSVNHQLHDALLTKDSQRYYQPNDLWKALGLDQPLVPPLMMSLLDPSSINTNLISGDPHNLDADMMSSLKIDAWKMERLHNGSDPNWHLDASDENLAGIPTIRLNLEGKYRDPDAPSVISSIRVSYWIKQLSGKAVCLQAMLTNLTLHTSYATTRQDWNNDGPRVWHTSTLNHDSSVTESDIVFRKIEPRANFSDSEIFSPVFPADYIVSDVTSGHGVVLQNPTPGIKVVTAATLPSKRFIIIIALSLTAVIPLGIAYLMKRKT